MSCPAVADRAATPPLLALRAAPRRIGLVGNPNVGKSALFGRLTGRYAAVSNYPGTTVGMTSGRALFGGETFDIVDTPGVNTLHGALSEDEEVTRRILDSGNLDVVVQVADARNLRRALMLTWQVAGFSRPLVVALNMVDEARARGIAVDVEGLAAELGVPVVSTVATDGEGLPALRQALLMARLPQHTPGRAAVDTATGDGAAWAHSLSERFRRVGAGRVGRASEVISRAVRHPIAGFPILLLVLYALYLIVGVFGAKTLVGLIEDGLFGRHVNPAAVWLAERAVPWPAGREFLVGPYGLVTMGLTYAIAIVLPVVVTFFLAFGWLEDSGYLPRLAIFSDRLFRLMGLNGKAVLPMVLGLGCDTMATMTTRMLATRKERIIAVILLALGIPCAAQLATIFGILGAVSFYALLTLFGVVIAQMFLVGFLAARVLPGERSDFILELPPMRLPRASNVARKTWQRVRWYLSEAVPIFLFGTSLLFVLDRTGLLSWLTRAAEPAVSGLLGLPAQTAEVFVMGFLRRDYGAAGLFQMAQGGNLSGVQAVVALTVMTLFMPCVANFLMIVKEQGAKVALAILVFVTAVAVATGAGLNYGCRILGVSF